MVKAKIEWKDGTTTEQKFKGPDEYFRFIYKNAVKIKVATSDADVYTEHKNVY